MVFLEKGEKDRISWRRREKNIERFFLLHFLTSFSLPFFFLLSGRSPRSGPGVDGWDDLAEHALGVVRPAHRPPLRCRHLQKPRAQRTQQEPSRLGWVWGKLVKINVFPSLFRHALFSPKKFRKRKWRNIFLYYLPLHSGRSFFNYFHSFWPFFFYFFPTHLYFLALFFYPLPWFIIRQGEYNFLFQQNETFFPSSIKTRKKTDLSDNRETKKNNPFFPPLWAGQRESLQNPPPPSNLLHAQLVLHALRGLILQQLLLAFHLLECLLVLTGLGGVVAEPGVVVILFCACLVGSQAQSDHVPAHHAAVPAGPPQVSPRFSEKKYRLFFSKKEKEKRMNFFSQSLERFQKVFF